MTTNRKPIPCSGCGEEIYFKGLCYKCRCRKERERYQALSETEINAMITRICNNAETFNDWGDVYKDFYGLLAYHDINTREIAHAALQKEVFYPPAIYRNASEDLQDEIIERLFNPYAKGAAHLLSCLAVCGSNQVLKVFYELEKNPLPWRTNLYVGPAEYAECGGWTFDEQGNRIELIYQDCYSIDATNPPNDAVKVGSLREEICSECGCNLVDMLTIDGTDPRLSFLGIEGTIKIPLCPNCASMCEKTIVRYTLNGDSTMEMIEPFAEENNLWDKEFEALTSNKLALSAAKQPIYYAYGPEEACTIGGHAAWVQDWQYETCPDCGKKMRLLSALAWDVLLSGSEGIIYFEICTDCSIVVAFHQQT